MVMIPGVGQTQTAGIANETTRIRALSNAERKRRRQGGIFSSVNAALQFLGQQSAAQNQALNRELERELAADAYANQRGLAAENFERSLKLGDIEFGREKELLKDDQTFKTGLSETEYQRALGRDETAWERQQRLRGMDDESRARFEADRRAWEEQQAAAQRMQQMMEIDQRLEGERTLMETQAALTTPPMEKVKQEMAVQRLQAMLQQGEQAGLKPEELNQMMQSGMQAASMGQMPSPPEAESADQMMMLAAQMLLDEDLKGELLNNYLLQDSQGISATGGRTIQEALNDWVAREPMNTEHLGRLAAIAHEQDLWPAVQRLDLERIPQFPPALERRGAMGGGWGGAPAVDAPRQNYYPEAGWWAKILDAMNVSGAMDKPEMYRSLVNRLREGKPIPPEYYQILNLR